MTSSLLELLIAAKNNLVKQILVKKRVVRDGLVGKLQVVSSSYIGILSKDTDYGTVYIGRQVVQVDM